MKAIQFTIGKEIHPHVEDIKTEDLFEASFFENAYEKAFSLMTELIKRFKAENKTSNFNNINHINNIIAFIGERGSGKTSCMLTVQQALQDRSFPTTKFQELAKEQFYTLPLIDPAYFEERSNILEIIIAKMFEQFRKIAEGPNDGRFNANFLEQKRELVLHFQRVKEALDRISSSNSSHVTNDSLEDLVSMSSSINLHQYLNDLVQCFLGFSERNVLVITIDDIDHETKYAYKMVEQIRKYLFIPNVVILTAIKLTQLTDIIKQYYIKEYQILDMKERLSDDIENITGRYLSKLIPYNHRVFLPELEVNLGQKITIIDGDKNLQFPTIDQAVLKLIFNKTRILFYNTIDKVNLIVPHNFRDLLNLISFLYHMPDVEEDKIKESILLFNREQFKQYFVETWCNEYLEAKHYNFIRHLIEQDPAQFNKLTVDFLTSMSKLEYCNTYVYSRNNRSYNSSLGDVDYILDKVEIQYNKPSVLIFVFAIKTLYSIYLYEFFDEMCAKDFIENQASTFVQKFNLQSVIIKDLKSYQKANKLAIYSKYERVLGGSLVLISRNVLENQKLYAGQIDASRLFYIWCLIRDDKVSAEGDDEEYQRKVLNYRTEVDGGKMKLQRLWEFFLLTTSNPIPHPNYRTFRHCFYDFYQYKLGREQRVVFDALSVLFNIIKYYNLYRHCYGYDPSGKALGEMGCFWRVIDSNDQLNGDKSESLLYNILHYNNKEAASEPGWRNKDLEDLFIRNMEMLDSLQDYISYLKRPRKSGNSEDCMRIRVTSLKEFYKKLQKFNFYTYSKSSNEVKVDPHTFKPLEGLTNFLSEVEKDERLLDLFDQIFNPKITS